MTDEVKAIQPLEQGWRTRVLLVGGLVGAILGVISAFLYVRAADEQRGGDEPPVGPGPGDAVRLGISLLGIIRTITEWGSR